LVSSSGGGAKKTGAVVKGYSGSGTADDPLLIQTVDDLMDLTRPEVGQKGYHFRQTADIDISRISTWPVINFKGYYDGNGRSITDKMNDNVKWIFKSVETSHFTKLYINNLALATTASNQCVFWGCKTNWYITNSADNCDYISCSVHCITENATNCKISYCEATGQLIAGKISNCKINNCQSSHLLVLREISSSKIEDCRVVFGEAHIGRNGVITHAASNSEISRCFVAGKNNNESNSGLVHTSNKTSITNCAVGYFYSERLYDPISTLSSENSIHHNIAIDSLKFYGNRHNTEIVAAARFKQRLFETTLGWDFENTWVWDDQNDRPALRHVGADNLPPSSGRFAADPPADHARAVVDLLTQQVTANIWL
jgi:MoxR-like ATPase